MSWLLYAMAVPPLLIVFLRIITLILPQSLAQKTSFAAFFITSFVMMAISATYGIVAPIFLRAIGYGGLSQWVVARMFKWLMWLTTGVTFRTVESGRIEGGRRGGDEALSTRPAVFIGNHQT